MRAKLSAASSWLLIFSFVAGIALRALPSYAASPKAAAPILHDGPPILTLREALKQGQIALSVEGDGFKTTHVRMKLTNKVDHELKVLIPANEVLHPNNPAVQKMIVTRDRIITVPVGQTGIGTIDTLCASYKTIAPPPKSGVDYTAADFGDDKTWRKLAAIIAAASDLDRRGAFKDLPIKKDTKERIAQLAVWRELGLKEPGRKDIQVTPESIGEDVIKELGEQVKKDPNLLAGLGEGYEINKQGNLIVSKKNRKAIDDKVDLIFGAIDLTVRRSDESDLKVASLPGDTPWDSYVSAGERAYDRGDFLESETLLKQASSEAEAFGEADPRLTRSLVSLGKMYRDYGAWEKADPLLDRARTLREKVNGKDSPAVGEVLDELGISKQQQSLFPPAEGHFTNALSIFQKSAGGKGSQVCRVLNHLGRNFVLENKPDQAESLLKQAMAMSIVAHPEVEGAKGMPPSLGNPELADIETNLGDALFQLGRVPEAGQLYKKALSIDTKALGNSNPAVARILDGLASVSTRQNQADAAELFRKQADTIRNELGVFKEVAKLPMDYDAYTRIKLFSQGAKDMDLSIDTVKASAKVIAAPSADKERVNRPIKDKWALVIGISKFKDPTINLQYASKDAKDFANFLKTKGQFSPDHVKVLTDSEATRENILAEIGDKWLPRVANPDDLVLIYISSHGSPSKLDLNGANYLVAHNTDKNSLYATGIPMKDLTAMIKDRVHSDRVLVLLDACHSGAVTATKGLYRVGNFDADEIAQGSGQLVICSSSPEQTSWESKRYQNGVFTHYLLEALEKQPDMKLGDAFKYMQDKVQEEVIRDRGEVQTPVLKTKWEGNDLVVTSKPTENRPGLVEEDEPVAQEIIETGAAGLGKGISKTVKAPPKAPAVQAKAQAASPSHAVKH